MLHGLPERESELGWLVYRGSALSERCRMLYNLNPSVAVSLVWSMRRGPGVPAGPEQHGHAEQLGLAQGAVGGGLGRGRARPPHVV